MSQYFHSAPELIFKLYTLQKYTSLSAPHGAKRLVTENSIFRDKISYNELLSSVINVGGETLYAQIHHEDTLCCVRA